MDCTVHGILEARILEWVAFPFSRKVTSSLTLFRYLKASERYLQALPKGIHPPVYGEALGPA